MEILVVNDGSPDNSEKIIQEYAKKYPFVKGLKKKNGGLSDARNYGIEHSKGEYLVFVDSDDYVENNMIEVLYNNIIPQELYAEKIYNSINEGINGKL